MAGYQLRVQRVVHSSVIQLRPVPLDAVRPADVPTISRMAGAMIPLDADRPHATAAELDEAGLPRTSG